MNDKDVLELIHTNIHALRISNPKSPTKFEMDMNKLIAEVFQDRCAECKEKNLQLKYSQPAKQGFLGGLFGK